jgi:MFS transporter, SP family, general alpha glucoside:H+ symporter
VCGLENQSPGSVISIPDFKERFGKPIDDGSYLIETSWQSALSNGSSAAAIVGAWASSYFADLMGIKPPR